jgi:integrase
LLVKLNGIHKVRAKLANGTTVTYHYAWRGGPRLLSKPGTEAYAAEYLRHKEQAKPRDTLATLIDAYMTFEGKPNPDWLALAETTRRDHEYAFGIIRKQFGDYPLKLSQGSDMKQEVRRWHRSFVTNPRKADKLLFSLSRLFSYGIEQGLVKENPCSGIPRLYDGSRRDFLWTDEQIAAFRSNAPAHLLLPFEIAVNTGQRQGDILALSWRAYDGEYLRFEQSKGGVRLKVKVAAGLKATLDALPRDHLRICLNSRGRPWTTDGFKTSWGKELARLGIEDVTFHDLRGTFITARRVEGSSIEDIALISGHSVSEIRRVLEKHYLSPKQEASDKVIRRMDRTQRQRKV